MSHFEPDTRIFLKVFLVALGLATILAIGYWLFGPSIIRTYHEGGSILFFPPDHNPDKGSLDEYSEKVSARFWNNIVASVPLSLLTLFGLYKLFLFLLTRTRRAGSPDPAPCESSVRYGVLIAGAVYLAFTLVYFWPNLRSFSSALIGPPEDNMQNYWVQRWAFDNVFQGSKSMSYVSDIFYPEGGTSYYHTWSFYNLLLSFGLRSFFNPTTTYNALLLHTFPLAGVGAYLLARKVTGSHWLGLLGGFLFAFNPAHFINALHHLNIASVQFIPLFVYFFIKSIRDESRWSLIWASLFFLLNALIDWNYLFYDIWFLLFAYLYLAIQRRQVILYDMIWKSGLLLGGTLLILSPWLVPMIRLALARGGIGAIGHNQFVVDLAAFVVPNPDHLLGSLFSGIHHSYTGLSWEGVGYVGLPALVIVILATRPLVSSMAKYILGVIVFAVMSLGAQPHLMGRLLPILIPGRLVRELPLVANARCPGRNMVFVYLFWSVVVSLAIGILWNRLRRTHARSLFAVLVSLLLMVDFFSVSRESTPVSLPACYGQLPHDQKRYGILDLPCGYDRVNRYMMYQSMHGLPIVQGWFSRKIDSTLIDSLDLRDLGHQKQQLNNARVRYVILHKIYLPNDSLDEAAYQRAYKKEYEDSESIVYQVY